MVEADAPFDRAAILARLRATFPGCFLYLVDGFLGASPELLVSRSGDVVRAPPIARTAPRGRDPPRDARLGAAAPSSPAPAERREGRECGRPWRNRGATN